MHPTAEPLVRATANHTRRELTTEQATALDALLHQCRERLAEANVQEARKLSAELNGLFGYLGEDLAKAAPGDVHYLLHSDTYQGEQLAGMLLDKLQGQKLAASLVRVEGLNTASVDSFRFAMNWLVKWCGEALPGYRQQGYRVVFNLPGGFKSFQGFMQALGSLYADQCIYIFDGSSEVLRIPRLPMALELVPQVAEHLALFRRLAVWKTLPARDPAVAAVPESLLEQIGGEVALSALGAVAWQEAAGQLLGRALLSPLDAAALRYGRALELAAGKLGPDLLRRLNEQLDDLARCLVQDGPERTYNPRSLRFKALTGNPRPPSTHECDAFGGDDARRLFGHFEEGHYVVDSLGEHL